jgi:parvulin-like peptidyl-prolyl isomerase
VLNRFFLICGLCFSLLFAEEWVFSVQDSTYSVREMYGFYGFSSWESASSEEKNKMIDDYLVREGAFLSARNSRLHFLPTVVEKLYNKKRQLLVNYVYQLEVAKMGSDSLLKSLGEKHLKQDLLIHHILIGYDGSFLKRDLGRNKEEAYLLCTSILDTLSIGSFKEVAYSYSDDGSAKRNFGELGWVSWGSTVPSFEKALFEAETNTLVGPIETPFGWHIAYVEDVRPSSFSFLSEEEYLDAALIRSSSKDVALLKRSSSHYDSLQLAKGNLIFNDSLIIAINNSFQSESFDGVNKNDIVGVLSALKRDGVVCVFKGEALGLDWFISRLGFFPPSSRPNIKNIDSFYSIFKTLLLQEEAVLKGLNLGYDLRSSFKKQVLSQEKDLLYSLYFKNLVNGVPKPDSAQVRSFYLKNRDKKYISPKNIKLQEVRSKDWAVADSLLSLYIRGFSFNSLVKGFSIAANSSEGGYVGPIEKGFRGGSFSSFFDKEVGYVGNVVENPDGSFSFFRIIEVFPQSYIPFEKVYSRASSLLYRDKQEEAKKNAIVNFYKDLKIVKNSSLF